MACALQHIHNEAWFLLGKVNHQPEDPRNKIYKNNSKMFIIYAFIPTHTHTHQKKKKNCTSFCEFAEASIWKILTKCTLLNTCFTSAKNQICSCSTFKDPFGATLNNLYKIVTLNTPVTLIRNQQESSRTSRNEGFSKFAPHSAGNFKP